jgi:hypothetical protein
VKDSNAERSHDDLAVTEIAGEERRRIVRDQRHDNSLVKGVSNKVYSALPLTTVNTQL